MNRCANTTPVQGTSQQLFVYDHNRLVERSTIYDLNDNGTFGDPGDNTLIATNSFDKKGNLVETYSEVDVDGDGFLDQSSRVTFIY